MAAASSMAELQLQILTEMSAAMAGAQVGMKADMEHALDSFYDGGSPKKYNRTYKMRNTPKTSPLSMTATSVTYDAYLDQSGGYTSGSKPSMGEVLRLANDGTPFTTKNGYPARPTVGTGQFWQRAEKDFEQTLDENMSRYFDKA